MNWQFKPPPGSGLALDDVAACESMFSKGHLSSVMSLLDDGYLRAGVLREWVEQGLLTPDQAYGLVHSVWTMSKHPLIYMPISDWVTVFRSVLYPVPTSTLDLWRGADHPYLPGMAWTTRRDVAHSFAVRQADRGNEAAIYAAAAPVGAVLAVFEEAAYAGEEGEVVVDPHLLLDLTVDEILAPSEEAARRRKSLHARLTRRPPGSGSGSSDPELR